MKITDGCNRVIGKFCGEETGRCVLVNDAVALLTFETEAKFEKSGFYLSFSFLPRGKSRARSRRSCCSMIAGMRTLVPLCPPFFYYSVSVNSISNT